MTSEFLESHEPHLFLLLNGTQFDDDKHFKSPETATKLFACTGKQMRKLSMYFEKRRYLQPGKSIFL